MEGRVEGVELGGEEEAEEIRLLGVSEGEDVRGSSLSLRWSAFSLVLALSFSGVGMVV